jgi:hypothetical protein
MWTSLSRRNELGQSDIDINSHFRILHWTSKSRDSTLCTLYQYVVFSFGFLSKMKWKWYTDPSDVQQYSSGQCKWTCPVNGSDGHHGTLTKETTRTIRQQLIQRAECSHLVIPDLRENLFTVKLVIASKAHLCSKKKKNASVHVPVVIVSKELKEVRKIYCGFCIQGAQSKKSMFDLKLTKFHL